MLETNEIEAIAREIEARFSSHKTNRWRRLLFLNFAVTLSVLIAAEALHVEVLFKGVEVIGAAGIHWLFFGRSE